MKICQLIKRSNKEHRYNLHASPRRCQSVTGQQHQENQSFSSSLTVTTTCTPHTSARWSTALHGTFQELEETRDSIGQLQNASSPGLYHRGARQRLFLREHRTRQCRIWRLWEKHWLSSGHSSRNSLARGQPLLRATILFSLNMMVSTELSFVCWCGNP